MVQNYSKYKYKSKKLTNNCFLSYYTLHSFDLFFLLNGYHFCYDISHNIVHFSCTNKCFEFVDCAKHSGPSSVAEVYQRNDQIKLNSA